MTSLREIFGGSFDIGVALGGTLPDDYAPWERALIDAHFTAITPENCMKPAAIQPAEGVFTFAEADSLVAFAEATGKRVTAHCLIWHEACPEWFFRDGDQLASRAVVLARMEAHIATLAGRYRGRVYSWDVVNEALTDGDGYLRDTPWVRQIGDDAVVQAYRFAHTADPDVRLVYNDYNIEQPAKREKTVRLLRELSDAGVPIAAVGIQGHWRLDSVPYAQIEEAIDTFHALGLEVMFTEVDLDVVLEQEGDPYATGCPPEVLERQAAQYAALFQLFHRQREKITRVAFWGLHDGRSWLNAWPRRRTNYPLLFDRHGLPKPALAGVLATRG